MIISHKNKFIFIKTRKTAGTSIEVYLSQFCGPKDIITPIGEETERFRLTGFQAQNYLKQTFEHKPFKKALKVLLGKKERKKKFFNHIAAHEIKENIPKKIWDNYFKFTVERNPFDKLKSRYYFELKRGKRTLPDNASFERFYDQIGQYSSDYSLYAENGIPCVDFIMRYENLEEDINNIKNILNLKEEKFPISELFFKKKNKNNNEERDLNFSYEIIRRINCDFSNELQLLYEGNEN